MKVNWSQNMFLVFNFIILKLRGVFILWWKITFGIFVKYFVFNIQIDNIYLKTYMFIQFFFFVFLLKTCLSFDEFWSSHLKQNEYYKNFNCTNSNYIFWFSCLHCIASWSKDFFSHKCILHNGNMVRCNV